MVPGLARGSLETISGDPKRTRQAAPGRPSVPAVSKSAKTAPPESDPAVPFEEALQKLESIVEAMESGELSLEQLLSKFEEGARLAKTCQKQLEAAEVRVQRLEQSLAGDLVTRPAAVPGEETGV